MTIDDLGRTIALYESPSHSVQPVVRLGRNAVRLTQRQMARLFGCGTSTISRHIANARNEEPSGISPVAESATGASDGKIYQVEYYGLDMIPSVGSAFSGAVYEHGGRLLTDSVTQPHSDLQSALRCTSDKRGDQS